MGAPSRNRRAAAVAGTLLGLAALAVLPYAGTLRFPLIHDDRTLLDNPWLFREADAAGVLGHDYWHGTRHEGSDLYRPLTVLTLAWNARLAASPAGFRGVNLALHALAVWLAFAVLWLLPRGERDPRRRLLGAAAGAALFAVHPLGAAAVMFVVGRAELLAAALGLGAFAVVLLAQERAADGRAARGAAAACSGALLFLAMCSKESAAAWIAILAAWWLLRRLRGLDARGLAGAAAAWLGAATGFVLLRGSVVGWLPHAPPWVDNPLVLHGAVARIANALGLQALYAWKMLWPRRLGIEYGFDQLPVLPLLPWGLAAGLAVAAAWLAVAAALWRRSAVAVFLWAFVPAAFSVTGNVPFPIGTIFAERLAYLPLVGACGLAGLVVTARWMRPAAGIALLVLATIGLGGRTVERTADFRDYARFVEAAVEASPRSVKALVNQGRLRLRAGRPAEALGPLERAIEIWPDYARALDLAAEAHAALGRHETAERYRARARDAAEPYREDAEIPPPR